MDFKKLSDRAKGIVDKRGGADSVKEDAEELKNIAKGQGSFGDKAKAAVSAIKEPGAGDGGSAAAEKVEGEEPGKPGPGA